MEPIEALSFKEIWFQGEPGVPVSIGEQVVQACALGEFVTSDERRMREFGIVASTDPALEGDEVSLPTVESIQTLRRPGPDGRMAFDTVAEIIQVRRVRPRDGKPGFELYGGSTVILNPAGRARVVVMKSVVGEGRLDRRLDFLEGQSGARFWKLKNRNYVLKAGSPFLALCQGPLPAAPAAGR